MILYSLLTYGRRPRTLEQWNQHPQMLTQLVRMRAYAAGKGIDVAGGAFDYHRAPRSLFNLKNLRRVLAGGHDVLIDSLGRLLRPAKPGDRPALLAELQEFGTQLHCAQSKRLLCDMDDGWISALQQCSDLERHLAHAARRQIGTHRARTASARTLSSAVRKIRSGKTVDQLEAIRAELHAVGKKGTGDEIASVANERGLRTQRGTEWTGGTVMQALRQRSDAAASTGVPAATGPEGDGQVTATG